MRILIRTSKWAIWARRIANIALPLTVIPLLMHRFRYIPSETFQTIGYVAVATAVLALVLSLGGLARIWSTGDRGWGLALTGLLLSLVCLGPAALAGYAIRHYPDLRDVSTDTASPPPLTIDPHWPAPTPEQIKAVEKAFPNVRTRHYAIEPTQVFDLIGKQVKQRGWTVQSEAELSPTADTALVDAEATTLAGWRDEVAIRVSSDPDGASVDMRSASTTNIHDLGANGQRIEEFLGALDTAVTALMRDMPANASPDDAASGDNGSSTDSAPVPAPARSGN
jgi:hypothetical protein